MVRMHRKRFVAFGFLQFVALWENQGCGWGSCFSQAALLEGETFWEAALPRCCSVEEKGSYSQLWFYSLLFYFYCSFLGLKLTFSFNLCSPFWARENKRCHALL